MSIVENFLTEIYGRLRQKQVAIMIDGQSLSQGYLGYLPVLRDKVKELGEIKVAEVFYENTVPKKDFDSLRQAGFSDVVIPGNIELVFLLDAYELILDEKVDFIILGTHREELIPLFTEIRKSATVFGLVDKLSDVSKAFEESFDGIIEVENIESFSFSSTSFSEFDQIMQQANGHAEQVSDKLMSDYTGTPEEVVDDANIGTFSEDYLEDDDMIKGIKKDQKDMKSD
ncbi:MAG: hypothetical protein ACXAE3_08870 [Candidatus Kariarchaeaceae archaeon]|jgi:uncharacterized protein (TIGR00288 family)